MAHVDASEIYGISERELYAEWQARGGNTSLADWLEAQYCEIGEQNPLVLPVM